MRAAHLGAICISSHAIFLCLALMSRVHTLFPWRWREGLAVSTRHSLQINLPLIQKHQLTTIGPRKKEWDASLGCLWLVSHESILLKRLCKSPSKQWLHERIPYQTRVGKARSGHLKYTTCDWCHSFPFCWCCRNQSGPVQATRVSLGHSGLSICRRCPRLGSFISH